MFDCSPRSIFDHVTAKSGFILQPKIGTFSQVKMTSHVLDRSSSRFRYILSSNRALSAFLRANFIDPSYYWRCAVLRVRRRVSSRFRVPDHVKGVAKIVHNVTVSAIFRFVQSNVIAFITSSSHTFTIIVGSMTVKLFIIPNASKRNCYHYDEYLANCKQNVHTLTFLTVFGFCAISPRACRLRGVYSGCN
jgi:hypothetical protein